MNSMVCGFLFNAEGEHVVLIRKNRPAWMEGFLNGIGGKVEPIDENSEDHRDSVKRFFRAMEREWFEEVDGVTVHVQDWIHFAVLKHPNEWEVHFFYAFAAPIMDLRASGIKAKTRETIHLVSVRNIALGIANVMPNLRYLIPMALNHYRGQDRCRLFEIDEFSYSDQTPLWPEPHLSIFNQKR